MYSNYWIANMASPWDADCRGKFTILQIKFDPDSYDNRPADGKFRLFKEIRETLEQQGKIEWLENNGIDFYNTFKVAASHNFAERQSTLHVLVDLPQQLRTLYTLTFK